LHRRVAEILGDRFADTAAAEPEVLAHHFTQASLTDAAIEWWGKAGDQALRRSAFQEAISHLGKAIEMADKADASSASSSAIANTSTSQRLKLQTTYGNALISARGYQAPETTAAFARARELAAEIEDASERVSVHYGQWAGCFVRAELPPMRELVQTLLSDCADRTESREAGVAYRLSGETNSFEGKFMEARTDLERALAIFDPNRDHELAFRFGQDVIVTANLFLACVLWPLGEVDRARRLAEEMVVQAVRGGHIATIAWVRVVHSLFEVMFGNPVRATTNVTEAVAVGARDEAMDGVRRFP
jgi:tetratricopeptide (TPR) repeat protein